MRDRRPAVVVHVPHAATAIPADVRPAFALSDAELGEELLRMTDHFVDELFLVPASVATTVRAPVSRLVVDVERFEDDAREPMADVGMGAVYTATHRCGTLRKQKVRAKEREDLLERFYRPHHRRLADAVAGAIAANGRCLVIDAHSFPSRPLPYERDARLPRPAVCIGTDADHTPDDLRRAAVAMFRRGLGSVAVDRPFSGALVPADFLGSDERVLAVMIEVRRDLYMDEETGRRLRRFTWVAAGLQAAVRRLGREAASIGREPAAAPQTAGRR